MKKRIIALILAVMTALPMILTAQAAEFSVTFDGVKLDSAVAPINEGGVVYVPLNMISEGVGADTSWNQTRRQAVITTTLYNIVFTLGSKNYTVNGAIKTMANAPILVDNVLMVPIKAYAEAIGASTKHDTTTNTTNVSYFSKMTGSLKIDGSTTVQPIVQAAADKLMATNKGLSITVAGGGSGTGIKDAQAGTVNIGMSSRELTADELKTLTVHAVANDGIAIIVHPDNPVKNLTREQASKIFLGEIKNWKDVGGENAPIMVMTRETGSGTRSTLEEMLLDRKSVVATATPFTSSTLIKQAVAKDKNAIGFDSVGFVDSSVRAVSLDKVSATSETVINGTYLMGRQLYLCTKGEPSKLAAVFIDYLKSKDCQDTIVENEGYVKLY